MAATSSKPSQLSSILLDESMLKGYQGYTDPGNMRPGECLQFENLFVDHVSPYTVLAGESPYSVRGGPGVSRPGILGGLTTPHSYPLVQPLPFLTGASTDLIYASGQLGSTGAKLYQYVQGADTDTEVKISGTTSFNFSTSMFRQARLGQFDYLIGSVNGLLYRTDLTGTGTTATPGMNAPIAAPGAALTTLLIDQLSSTANWYQDTFSGASTAAVNNYFLQGGANVVQVALNNVGNDGGSSGGLYINEDGTRTGSAQSNSICFGVGLNPAIEPAGTEGLPASFGFTPGVVTPTSSWMQFDNPGEGFVSCFGLNQYQSPALVAPNTDRTCSQFYMSVNYYTSDTSSRQAVSFTVNVYSDTAATTQIGSKTLSFTPVYSNQSPGQYKDFVFDFSDLPTNILAVRVSWGGGASNRSGNWVYIANPTFSPIPNGYTLTELPTGGFAISHSEPTSAYWGAEGATRLTYDLAPGGGNTANYGQYDTLLLGLATPSGSSLTVNDLVSAGLSMQLGFRLDGSSVHNLTNDLTFATDGTYAAVDISTVPESVRAAFRYLEIIFNADLAVSETTTQFLSLTSLSTSGNLSTGPVGITQSFAPVWYIYTEININGDVLCVNIIESDGSPGSSAIYPTLGGAVGKVTLPVFPKRINAAATHYCVYRYGGAWTDGYGRIIGTFPINLDVNNGLNLTDLAIDAANDMKVTSASHAFVSADIGQTIYISSGVGFISGLYQVDSISGTAAILNAPAGTISSTGGNARFGGDNYTRDLSNPNYTWNHTTGVLLDNTSDTFLGINATVFEQGRNTPPTGAQAIAVWQGRLWLAVGSTLYASWSIQANAEGGLYFTIVDIPTDPSLAVKGFTYTIAGDDNDPIQAIVPAPTGELLIFKQLSAYRVFGTDPTNFEIQPISPAGVTQACGSMGVGLSAPKAVAVDVLGQCVWFLAANGIWKYAGGVVQYAGTNLRGVLDGSVINNPTAWANIAMSMHNMKLYIFAPVLTTDNVNTCAWIYDTFVGTWSQSTGAHYQFTGATSLSAASDANAIFYTGFDGQIYTESGWADQATPTAQPVPITWTLQTRGLGREDGGGTARYSETIPSMAYLAGIASEDTTLTVIVGPITYNGATAANACTKTWSTAPTLFGHSFNINVSARGQLVTLTVSGQTTNAQFVLQAIALAVAEGTLRS